MRCILAVSHWSLFSTDERAIANNIFTNATLDLARRRLRNLNAMTTLTAKPYGEDLARTLNDTVPLCNARAASLWLYNGSTHTYTLSAASNIAPDHYQQDWFSCDEETTLNSFHVSSDDIAHFTPSPEASANPKVAALFSHGHLCHLRSPFSGNTLGVLVFYEVTETPLAPPRHTLEIIRQSLSIHLAALRANRRRIGLAISQTLFEHNATLTSALQSLCQQVSQLMHFDACSVFLKDGPSEINAHLVATYDAESETKELAGPASPPTYYLKAGLTGQVLSSGSLRAAYDLSGHKTASQPAYSESLRGPQRNWLGVPIRSPAHDETIGVLRVVNKYRVSHKGDYTPAHFQGSDIDSLTYLATIIGYLWSNAQLRDEAALHLKSAQRERDDKAKFLNSLTHEMNAPLQPMQNILSHITDIVRAKLPKEKRLHYFLETASCECESMRLMLGSVSTLSDPKTAASPEELGIISDIIHPIKNLFEQQARVNKQATIYFDHTMHSLPTVFADRILAKQVVFALVHNALKYCDHGSTINIDGSLDATQTHVAISVANVGFEIPEDWEERVFDRGERAPNVKRQFVPGTGLGLTIARSLTKAMDGSLRVRSRTNPVTFVLELPLAHGGI